LIVIGLGVTVQSLIYAYFNDEIKFTKDIASHEKWTRADRTIAKVTLWIAYIVMLLPIVATFIGVGLLAYQWVSSVIHP
jgi:uncharacterized membrane protein